MCLHEALIISVVSPLYGNRNDVGRFMEIGRIMIQVGNKPQKQCTATQTHMETSGRMLQKMVTFLQGATKNLEIK